MDDLTKTTDACYLFCADYHQYLQSSISVYLIIQHHLNYSYVSIDATLYFVCRVDMSVLWIESLPHG